MCEFDVDKKINSVRNAMGSKDYNKAIRLGLFLYNNKDFNTLSNYNKDIIVYNLALCYRKIGMEKQAIEFLKLSLEFTDEEDQGYYQTLWLINNCEIELKEENKEEILQRFELCLQYYKSIKDRQMRAHILYNISKYQRRIFSMYRTFKQIVKESDSIIPIFIDYDKRAEIISILEDFSQIDEELLKRAKYYLQQRVVSIDSIR